MGASDRNMTSYFLMLVFRSHTNERGNWIELSQVHWKGKLTGLIGRRRLVLIFHPWASSILPIKATITHFEGVKCKELTLWACFRQRSLFAFKIPPIFPPHYASLFRMPSGFTINTQFNNLYHKLLQRVA